MLPATPPPMALAEGPEPVERVDRVGATDPEKDLVQAVGVLLRDRHDLRRIVGRTLIDHIESLYVQCACSTAAPGCDSV